MADAAVDSTRVLRRGGERLVTTDGRNPAAASRRVDDSIILGLVDDDGIILVLPVGRTKALQLVAAAAKSTADRSIRGIIISLVLCI